MNWRIQRLNERKAVLLKSSESVLELAAKEDREPTETESATLAANQKELTELAAKLDRETQLAAHAATAPSIPQEGMAQPGNQAGKIGNARECFEDDPKVGFKSPREFLSTVLNVPGSAAATEARDNRLKFLATAGSDEQGGYSDPYGGFLVPVGFAPELLKLQPEDDPIAGRVTNIPMTSRLVEIPARTDKDHTTSVSGGLTVTRRAETQTQSATRMQMEKIALSAYSLFGLSYATEEILSDSPMSFVALLEAGFRDQFQYHLINERLNGTGVGEFEGILNSPALVTVTKDTNQTNTTITGTNVVNMRARCWRYSDAIWLANHDTLPQIVGVRLETSGGYPISVYQPSLKEGEPDMLLGRPIYYTEYANTLGTKGDLILANWSQYLEGTFEPLQNASSIHVRFVNHERTFKFWMRNAAKCWWRSALTPKNSSNTLSPFVVLAGRP